MSGGESEGESSVSEGKSSVSEGESSVSEDDDLVPPLLDHFVICGLQEAYYGDLIDRVHRALALDGQVLVKHPIPRSTVTPPVAAHHPPASLGPGRPGGRHRRYHSEGGAAPPLTRTKLASVQDALTGASHTPYRGRPRSQSLHPVPSDKLLENDHEPYGHPIADPEGLDKYGDNEPNGFPIANPKGPENNEDNEPSDIDPTLLQLNLEPTSDQSSDSDDDEPVLLHEDTLEPITDIVLLNPCLEEPMPIGYEVMAESQHGAAYPLTIPASMGKSSEGLSGSASAVSDHDAHQMLYVCFKRGNDPSYAPPITHIHLIMVPEDLATSEIKRGTGLQDRLPPGFHVLQRTVTGYPAYVCLPGRTECYVFVYRRDPCHEGRHVTPIYNLYATLPRDPATTDMAVGGDDEGEDDLDDAEFITVLPWPASAGSRVVAATGLWVSRKANLLDVQSLVATQPLHHYTASTSHVPPPLPNSLALFTHPTGVRCHQGAPSVRLATCRLTNQLGTPVFVTSLYFDDRYRHRRQSGVCEVWYVQRSLHVLSRYPFYPAFTRVLLHLHGLLLARPGLPVPMERYVLNLFEVPVPTPGNMMVDFQLPLPFPRQPTPAPHPTPLPQTTCRMTFQQPAEEALPYERFPAITPFHCLSAYNVVLIVNLLLVEAKLLFHAQEERVLNAVMESLGQFLFPFRWQYLFLSVLPPALVDFLQAPVPFVMGMRTSTYEEMAAMALHDGPSSLPPTPPLLPPDTVIVDLNENTVTPIDGYPNLPNFHAFVADIGTILVAHEARQAALLTATLPPPGPTPARQDFPDGSMAACYTLRRAFLNYFIELLSNYTDSLRDPSFGKSTHSLVHPSNASDADPANLFDRASFIASAHPLFRPFYTSFFETLIFTKFMEERTFISESNASMVYFDNEMEARLNELQQVRDEQEKASAQAHDAPQEASSKDALRPLARQSSRYAPAAGKTTRTTRSRRSSYAMQRRVLTPKVHRGGIEEGRVFRYDRFPGLDAAWFYTPLRRIAVTREDGVEAAHRPVSPRGETTPNDGAEALPPPLPRRKSSAHTVMIDREGEALRHRATTMPLKGPQRRKHWSYLGASRSLSSSLDHLNGGEDRSYFGGVGSLVEAARELFAVMVYTWFHLFTTYASRASSTIATVALQNALELLADLRGTSATHPMCQGKYAQTNFVVDVDLYEWLLRICGRVGLRREAQSIFQDMTQHGIRPNARAYAWIMEAAASGHQTTMTDKKLDVSHDSTWKKFRSLVTDAKDWHLNPMKRRSSLGRSLDVPGFKSLGKYGGKLRRSRSFDGSTNEDVKENDTEAASLRDTPKSETVNPFEKALMEHTDLFTDKLDLSFVLLEARCTCQKCNYTLQEVDIFAGWIMTNRPCHSICTKCRSPVYPELQVSLSKKELSESDRIIAHHIVGNEKREKYRTFLLKPSAFFDEIGMQILNRPKAKLWRSKVHMMKENPLLFWNFVWMSSVISFPFVYTPPKAPDLMNSSRPLASSNKKPTPTSKPGLKPSLLLARFGSAIGSGWASKFSIDTNVSSEDTLEKAQTMSNLVQSRPTPPDSSSYIGFSVNELANRSTENVPVASIAINGLLRSIRGLPERPISPIILLRDRLNIARKTDMGLNISLESIERALEGSNVGMALKMFITARSRYEKKGLYGNYFYGSAYDGLWLLPEAARVYNTEAQFAKEFEKGSYWLEPSLRQELDIESDRPPTASVLAIRQVFNHLSYF